MSMDGYAGKVLVVELSAKEIYDEPLNEKYARQFVGGAGLACRYLYDLVDATTDALGPENPLVFMNGLLTGTSAPSTARWVVAARSPLTGIYGESNCGGFFGAELRFAGYDGLVVKGRSPSPVYLHIAEGQAKIRDAAHLWGQDTYSTVTALKSECGDERTRAVCIGQAGERLAPYAAIISEGGRAAGRTGMGAVMGSKNLKAIAVRGKGRLPMTDSQRFQVIVRQSMNGLQDALTSQIFRDFGTSSWVDPGIAFGSMPNKYYTQGAFPESTAMSGVTMAETILTGMSGCFGCPIRCGRVVHIKEGKYALPEGGGPEYETVAAWGTMLLINDLAAVNYISHLCNAYGLDSISAGVSASFAFYLYDLGVITMKDTGGLELRWGNADDAIDLLHQMGQMKGFGAVVSEGVRRMGERYGRAGEAAHVKGLEIPMHDPRAFASMGLVYATSPRGACHNRGDAWAVEFGMGNPDLDLVPSDRFSDDKAASVIKSQNWRAFTDSIGLCHFAMMPLQEIFDMINAATGWRMDANELMRTGERIFQLQRALACRFGTTAKDDKLPEILMRPLPEGETGGHVPNMEKMMSEYYNLRSWEPATGKPSRERLINLDLADVADDIWRV